MTSEFVGVVVAVVNKTTTGEAVATEVYTLQQMHAQTVCFGTAHPHMCHSVDSPLFVWVCMCAHLGFLCLDRGDARLHSQDPPPLDQVP